MEERSGLLSGEGAYCASGVALDEAMLRRRRGERRRLRMWEATILTCVLAARPVFAVDGNEKDESSEAALRCGEGQMTIRLAHHRLRVESTWAPAEPVAVQHRSTGQAPRVRLT